MDFSYYLMSVVLLFFFLLLRPPPISTLFPYTTLFRSARDKSANASQVRSTRGCRSKSDLRDQLSPTSLQSFDPCRSEEHTSELQSPYDLVCRLLLEKKKQ